MVQLHVRQEYRQTVYVTRLDPLPLTFSAFGWNLVLARFSGINMAVQHCKSKWALELHQLD